MRSEFLIPIFVLLTALCHSCDKEQQRFDWDKYESTDSTLVSGNIKDMQKVFSFFPEKRYSYCPSVIEEGDIQHVFFCGNPDENIFIDNIYYMTISREGKASSAKSVLQPTNKLNFWDNQHVCDPSVIAGNFGYKGVSYKYAMFFLGSTKDFYYNEIGVAFSNDLGGDSWVKFDTVLLKKPWVQNGDFQVTSDIKAWGIGQPEAITLDPEKGDVLLTYTRGDNTGTRIVYRVLSNMKEAGQMEIGVEKPITNNGISKYGSNEQDYLSNAAIALNVENDQFIMIRYMSPLSTVYPTFIHSYMEITKIGTEDFYNNSGQWEPVSRITPADTNFPRNHNAGLVRDQYGHTVSDLDTLEFYFTTSQEAPEVEATYGNFAEWTYEIWRARLSIHN